MGIWRCFAGLFSKKSGLSSPGIASVLLFRHVTAWPPWRHGVLGQELREDQTLQFLGEKPMPKRRPVSLRARRAGVDGTSV